jgi:hypothetical protein
MEAVSRKILKIKDQLICSSALSSQHECHRFKHNEDLFSNSTEGAVSSCSCVSTHGSGGNHKLVQY